MKLKLKVKRYMMIVEIVLKAYTTLSLKVIDIVFNITLNGSTNRKKDIYWSIFRE